MADESCGPPTTVGVASGHVQVASGVRGLAQFAARQDFQACFDAKLLKACDPRLDNNACTATLADGVTTCQIKSQMRQGMSASCPASKNLGFTDPSTCSVWAPADVNWTVAPVTSLCTWQRQVGTSVVPSPAQACLEDATEEQLTQAGASGAPTTTFPATRMMGKQTYTSPQVGDNLPKRMSRTPVFFDATQTWAPTYLARTFYAMHKRWGGQDEAKCCTATPSAACPAPAGGHECGLYSATKGLCPHATGSEWWNGGVRKENIYFADRAAGKGAAGEGAMEQVLCLRFQGDLTVATLNASLEERQSSTAGIPALGRTVDLNTSDLSAYMNGFNSDALIGTPYPAQKVSCETCKVYPTNSEGAARVGAVLTSAENYGGGVFEVYARVPPANDYEQGGQGMVWAMWTFAYTETYPSGSAAASGVNMPTGKGDGGWQLDPLGQQLPGNLMTSIDTEHLESKGMNLFTCGLVSHNCDKTSNWCPPGEAGKSCSLNSGPYTVFNHEIDIEIPSNACRLPRVDLNQAVTGTAVKAAGAPLPGWFSDTWNANTWLGDNQDYLDWESYRNNGIRRMDGNSFIASAQNDFHWYGIVWCTGSDSTTELTAPYVDFYFDRKRIHRITNTFIPSRAGKLNIGPWFGWWGGTPNFGSREVWIKYCNILPFAAVNDPWACTPGAGAPQTVVPCTADSSLDVTTLAALYASPDGGKTPPSVVTTKGHTRLPHMTAAQLAQLYTIVAGAQTKQGLRPMPKPITVSGCDVAASTNDVTGPQAFDQCGASNVRNVCDFNQFLVNGDDGSLTGAVVESGAIPSGFVLAAIEPLNKCNRVTQGMMYTADGSAGTLTTTSWLNPTVQRWLYYDITVDPQPASAFHPRPHFPQTQFLEGKPSADALLCGDPAVRTFTKGVNFCGAPKKKPSSKPTGGVPVATTRLAAAVGAAAPAMSDTFKLILTVLILLLVMCVVGWLVARSRSSRRSGAP